MPLLKAEVIKYMFDTIDDSQVTVPIWPSGRIETLFMALERDKAALITRTLCHLKRSRSDDIIRGAEKVLLISPMGKIKKIDPELKSFVNVNRPEDLSKLQTRQAQGNVNEDLKIHQGTLILPELGRLEDAVELFHAQKYNQALDAFESCATNFEEARSFFWAGVCHENEGESLQGWSKIQEAEVATEMDLRSRDFFLAAASDYRQEAEMHLKARCRFFAERAWADKTWCESRVMGMAGGNERHPSKN